MRQLFRSKLRVTQPFGADHELTINGKTMKASEYYGKYGLSGHEGLDCVPTGSVKDVLCLDDGVVVRDIDDALSGKNYGKNVTIWHAAINKATQYCHLESNSVKMGQFLKKGDVLGSMGATGNTSGAHVHLNLFVVDDNGIRLNRDNGYAGGIDPWPFLEIDEAPPRDLEKELSEAVDLRNQYHNDRMALYEELGYNGKFNRTVAIERIKMLKEIERKSGEYLEQIKTLKEDLKNANDDVADAREELRMLKENNTAVITTTGVVDQKIDLTLKKVEEIGDKVNLMLDERPVEGFWKSLIALIKKHL